MTEQTQERYANEREFFDGVASLADVQPMSRRELDRYAHPRQPHLFAKEKVFALLDDAQGKKLLEVGCGQGIVSVQLANLGAQVVGLDISSKSIEVARRRIEINGFEATFQVANIETDDLGTELYDVVVCYDVLHHVVPALNEVMTRIRRCLKPGGKFLSREPVAYAAWLKKLRRALPVKMNETAGERPLRAAEFEIIQKHFPNLKTWYFRLSARIDSVTENLGLIRQAARVDNLLLKIPGAKRLAGDVVLFATKQ